MNTAAKYTANEEKLDNVWGGIRAIDQDKHNYERSKVLKFYNDYNMSLIKTNNKNKELYKKKVYEDMKESQIKQEQ